LDVHLSSAGLVVDEGTSPKGFGEVVASQWGLGRLPGQSSDAVASCFSIGGEIHEALKKLMQVSWRTWLLDCGGQMLVKHDSQ